MLSLLLQAAIDSRRQRIKTRPEEVLSRQVRKGAKEEPTGSRGSSFAFLRFCNETIWHLRTRSQDLSRSFSTRKYFALFLGKRFTGNSILTFDPATEVDELTSLGTEGTKRIFFPLGWLTAGWTFHRILKPRNGRTSFRQGRGSFDQYSSFDEFDRTFAAHGIQADGDTFAG